MKTVLGVALTGNPQADLKAALSALLTFIVVFFINFGYDMIALNHTPVADELWTPFWKSLVIALVIYAANKGIQWRYNAKNPDTGSST